MILAWTNFWTTFANMFQISSNVTQGGVVITEALIGKASIVATDVDMEVAQATKARNDLRIKLGLATA